MPDTAVAAGSGSRLRVRTRRPPGASGPPWRPVWSVPAALRALRATVVVPGVFVLTFKVIANPQMALFATFGAFATLVLASFGGNRRDKAIAHLGLAVAGSVALTIGTAVSGTAWLAALVTIPVAFAIYFAEVAGPNAGSGVTAALLAYVLPVASAGTVTEIQSRLAGWWLAAAVGTAAVLLLSPPATENRLRTAASASASALARWLAAAAEGTATPDDREAAMAAKRALMDAFAATPYRPTGLATADQGLANAVELLEWCTSLASDALDGHPGLRRAAADHELLRAVGELLDDVARMLGGAADVTSQDVGRAIDRVQRARAVSAARCLTPSEDPRVSAASAADLDAIALVARAAAVDTMIAARRASPGIIADARRSWFAGRQDAPLPAEGRLAGLTSAARVAAAQASLRSVWFRNSARGAVALAIAVAVADASGVQHAFWVVLGALSVLRTNAAATGATVWRAMAGQVIGFAVGAALLLGIGTGQTALWIALPIAVAIASYTPGTAPFALGQAAFTITVVVLFNLLVPTGWTVGLLRVEDVALGSGVSLVVGFLFWPRGASSAVGDDLADAFRRGAAYLTQAVDWALGLRDQAPGAAMAAITAGNRLDDALRTFLAEQGAKRVRKEDLWSLVMGTTRLRLTAASVAELRGQGSRDAVEPAALPGSAGAAQVALQRQAGDLAVFYGRIADQVGPPRRGDQTLVPLPDLGGIDSMDGEATATGYPPRALWVRQHLRHLGDHARAITQPAEQVARLRRIPWWR